MWIKNMRHRKFQLLLMLFITMLCTMLLCASINILTSLERPFRALANDTKAATSIAYPGLSGEEEAKRVEEKFKDLKEVDRVEVLKKHYISEELTHEGKKIEAFVDLVEYRDTVYRTARFSEGGQNAAENLKNDECVIPLCIANDNQIELGDHISIKSGEEEYLYKVVATYAEIYNSSTAYDSGILISDMPGALGGEYLLYIYGNDGYSGEEIEEAFRESTQEEPMGVQMRTLNDTIENIQLPLKIMGAILLSMGLIMLVVSGLIINFMVRNTILNDAKQIAIYKTLGYSMREITNMYVLSYFIVVSVGSIAGIIAANLFSMEILGSMFENLGHVARTYSIIPGMLCYLLVAGFVVTLIYLIIRKTKNIKPIHAISGFEYVSTKKRPAGKSKMQFSSFGIACRYLIKDKRGAFGIILTSIVSIFAINFAVVSIDIANAMKKNNDYWLGIANSDIMVTLSEGMEDTTLMEELENDPNIEKMLSSTLSTKVTLDWKKGMSKTVMYPFVYEDFDKVGLETIQGRNPRTGDEIAISGLMSEDTGRTIGDYIDIYINDEKYSFLVTGLFQSYYNMGESCRLTKAAYEERNIPLKSDTVSIFLKDGVDVKKALEAIKEQVDGKGNVMLRSEMYGSIMSMIMSPQQKALPAVTILVMVTGGVNIFCIVLLKNGKNQRNNGIYKSIGYSTRHLVLSNVWYVGILALGSICVAVPLVLISYPHIMKLSLSMFGLLEYCVEYDEVHLFGINMIVILAFIFSTVASSGSLYRANIKDLVQE